jgi:predicted transcriptional regulator
MRAAAKGTLPSISFLVDYDTLESCAREQPPKKSVGTDRVPRELYKYGPRPFLELLRAAINAYLQGKRPTVRSHEWMGAIVTFIAKQLSAAKISEFRPVASICAKFAILKIMGSLKMRRRASAKTVAPSASCVNCSVSWQLSAEPKVSLSCSS